MTQVALTRTFRETVLDRANADPEFRTALVEEALQAVVDGDLAEARLMLRDCINATVGFDRLSELTKVPAKSLMRMVGPSGNPTANHLLSILKILQNEVHTRAVVELRAVA